MPTSNMLSGKSEINISGYNLDDSIWTLLNDRIIVRKRGFGGKMKKQEIFLRDIVAIGYFYSDSSSGSGSIYLQLTPGKLHRGITLHSDSPDQLSALLYIKSHYGRLYEIALQEEQKQQELDQKILDGKWTIPVEKFYIRCRDSNITKFDNEFAVAKATRYIEEFIYEVSDLPVSKCNYYLDPVHMTQFYEAGRKLAEIKSARELATQKIPKGVVPNPSEKNYIQRTTAISYLSGNKKRVEMLNNLLSSYSQRIQAIADGEEALKELGMIYMQQQKKERDWAVAGGIAEGIAGPVAGFMAASQVMENNRKLQQHNEAMRNTSRNILSGIPSMMSDRIALEREQKETRQQLQNAYEKITLSKPNAAEIWNHIQIGRYKIEKAESGVLHIALPVRIETPFVLDVPKNVNTVIDGTLKAEVQFESRNVGFVNFPLPLYGIPTNMTAEVTLDGMLDRSVEFNGEYTLKMLDSHNLWIMEA